MPSVNETRALAATPKPPEESVQHRSDPPSSLEKSVSGNCSDPEEVQEEIIVANPNRRKFSPSRLPLEQDDEETPDADELVVSRYPKKSAGDKHPSDGSKKHARSVILGYWRDTSGHDENTQHAVIGFVDVWERLRTRIQPINISGEPISSEYPLPPSPGGSWVTFERVVFSKHLVGLDHHQIKEYVRIRSEVKNEPTEEARKAGEKAAVKEAIRRVKQNPVNNSNPNPPLIAYGLNIPDHLTSANRPDAKRRRISSDFAAINPTPTNGVSQGQDPPPPPQQQPLAPTVPLRAPADPLLGTRPTRILLGHWKISSESDPQNRHAVYGILGQNDMFRVKLVRETRDGRFVDGNFPTGAGALWIPYEEVEFEEHLRSLQRLEIKEYCRVRQYQLDHGEAPEDRAAHELRAVQEAQARAGTGYSKDENSQIASSYTAIAPEPPAESNEQSPRAGFGGHELRQSRRVEARENRPLRQPLPEAEARPPANRVQSGDALERTNSLARREIARAEAAQVRADKHAAHRERVAAAAADAANAAVAAIPPVTNGRARLHESEDMQRLNKVWARQENLRVKAGVEDAKIHGGIKYERKKTGLFLGKLVSQGAIINIDGEDYVEYRVLTKPSFF
ncbi:hypothetical protein BGZ63DRAFT_435528 [Mariannaea sp. PMI_226]|nr:hypothetical protein BGZ63DRAFT_435528 [Mariannaea sp. PMI_226]